MMASRSSITAGIRIASASASSSTSSSSRLLQNASRQASSSSSSSTAIASLLKTTPAAALATPGLTFTSSSTGSKHPHAPQPQTASINMCTVGIIPPSTFLSNRLPLHHHTQPAQQQHHPLSLSPRYFSTSASTPSPQIATSPSPSQSSPPPSLPQTKRVRVTYSQDRKYPPRKAFLYSAYARLLASSDLVVLLQYGNLTVSEWNKLRSDLAAIPTPTPNTPRASVVAVRAALLGALLRSHPNAHVKELANACSGPLAFLYFPTAALVKSVAESQVAPLTAAKEGEHEDASAKEQPTIDDIDPRYVEKVLTVLDKAFGGKAAPAPPKDLDPFSVAANSEGSQLTQGNPRLLPLGALFYPSRAVQPATNAEEKPTSTAVPEGFQPVPESAQPPTRLLPVLSLRAIASHSPDLTTLRAQMVGLIGAPAQSLVGILSSAGGAGLVRVLRGYVAGLEKESEGGATSSEEKKDA